ncbi:RNaseH domain-containing protein [Streptomyces shenzhenensis]|uniref:RNaseH domain-containing protein n=1 Tax=Streptomyces shenzhenensis TaxID=943815 RepID=UPI0037DA799D
MTRWDAGPGKDGEERGRETNELKTPWRAVTATEIYPVGIANGVDRTMPLRATARLCHQTIAGPTVPANPCLCMQRNSSTSTTPNTIGRRRPRNKDTKPPTGSPGKRCQQRCQEEGPDSLLAQSMAVSSRIPWLLIQVVRLAVGTVNRHAARGRSRGQAC